MNQSTHSTQVDNFSIQRELKKYIIHWKWFLFSALLFVLIGGLYLKKTAPVYNSVSTILIKDNREGRGLSELAAFSDLAGLSGGNNDIDDEVDIIKSKTILSKVVTKLNLNILLQEKKGLRTNDLYSNSPISVRFKFNDFYSDSNNEDIEPFKIYINSNDSFEFENTILKHKKKYKFPAEIAHQYGVFYISKNEFYSKPLDEDSMQREISIFVNNIENTSINFKSRISVRAKNKRSSLLDISLKSTNKDKAFDFINTLVDEYNKEAIRDKNLVSKNTIEFVDQRLDRISKELNVVELNKTKFKKGNKLTDIKAEAQLFIDQVGGSQKSILENETQIDLNTSILNYLENKTDEFSLLPANIGINNQSINQSITSYNDLILERKRLLENSTELNPLVKDLTYNITSIKANLLEALRNQKKNLEVIKKELKKQQSKINTRMSSIPGIEKDFRVIERQQQIKENLYLFLLKKKEEVSISMAVTTPPAKVIDRAYSSKYPIAPKKQKILLISLFIGLLLPFAVIYIKDLLDTKVNDKSDVEEYLKDTPVLVEVGRIKKGNTDILQVNDRSVLGESFRILRTNLNYLVKNKKRAGKALRVFVTSTVKGEGKTFISFNTVLALADTKKKILVVGADIRNPQLHRYLQNNKNQKGLSEYLYDDGLTFSDVVNKIEFNNNEIDYVTSGRIPPNPSELLMNGRLDVLLDEVDDYYDYIIVDTAPTMLVTDTQIICESADVTIYVVRSGYTEKELLSYSKGLKKDGKIKNMAVVLNDVKEDKIGYGYSYGYGAKEKSLLDKLLRR